jgi:hypothetical protein
MREFMKVPEQAADLLYDSARCGIFHQGMTPVGVVLINDPTGINPHLIGTVDTRIVLNVTLLAHTYLAAVKQLQRSPELIRHVPPVTEREIDGARTVFSMGLHRYSSLDDCDCSGSRIEDLSDYLTVRE